MNPALKRETTAAAGFFSGSSERWPRVIRADGLLWQG